LSYKTGKDKRLQFYNAGDSALLPIGVMRNISVRPEVRNMIREPGTATRKLQLLKAGLIVPRLTFTWDLQSWTATEEFITKYCIPTAEGARTLVDMEYYDGTEKNELDDVLIDRFTCRCTSGDLIKATAEGYAKNILDGTGTFVAEQTTQAMDWTKATVKIAGSTLTNWLNWEFGVNHNIDVIQTGTDQTPSDLLEKEALYTGSIRLARDSNDTKVDDLIAETKPASIAYLLVDYGTPTTKTFTFTSPIYRTVTVDMVDLNLSIENIVWECNALAIT